jgi:hypothetical protein
MAFLAALCALSGTITLLLFWNEWRTLESIDSPATPAQVVQPASCDLGWTHCELGEEAWLVVYTHADGLEQPATIRAKRGAYEPGSRLSIRYSRKYPMIAQDTARTSTSVPIHRPGQGGGPRAMMAFGAFAWLLALFLAGTAIVWKRRLKAAPRPRNAYLTPRSEITTHGALDDDEGRPPDAWGESRLSEPRRLFGRTQEPAPDAVALRKTEASTGVKDPPDNQHERDGRGHRQECVEGPRSQRVPVPADE